MIELEPSTVVPTPPNTPTPANEEGKTVTATANAFRSHTSNSNPLPSQMKLSPLKINKAIAELQNKNSTEALLEIDANVFAGIFLRQNLSNAKKVTQTLKALTGEDPFRKNEKVSQLCTEILNSVSESDSVEKLQRGIEITTFLLYAALKEGSPQSGEIHEVCLKLKAMALNKKFSDDITDETRHLLNYTMGKSIESVSGKGKSNRLTMKDYRLGGMGFSQDQIDHSVSSIQRDQTTRQFDLKSFTTTCHGEVVDLKAKVKDVRRDEGTASPSSSHSGGIANVDNSCYLNALVQQMRGLDILPLLRAVLEKNQEDTASLYQSCNKEVALELLPNLISLLDHQNQSLSPEESGQLAINCLRILNKINADKFPLKGQADLTEALNTLLDVILPDLNKLKNQAITDLNLPIDTTEVDLVSGKVLEGFKTHLNCTPHFFVQTENLTLPDGNETIVEKFELAFTTIESPFITAEKLGESEQASIDAKLRILINKKGLHSDVQTYKTQNPNHVDITLSTKFSVFPHDANPAPVVRRLNRNAISVPFIEQYFGLDTSTMETLETVFNHFDGANVKIAPVKFGKFFKDFEEDPRIQSLGLNPKVVELYCKARTNIRQKVCLPFTELATNPDIKCFTVHDGTTTGHYRTFRKFKDGWYEYNDSSVTKCPNDPRADQYNQCNVYTFTVNGELTQGPQALTPSNQAAATQNAARVSSNGSAVSWHQHLRANPSKVIVAEDPNTSQCIEHGFCSTRGNVMISRLNSGDLAKKHMIYVVPPKKRDFKTENEFLEEVKTVTKELFETVKAYNNAVANEADKVTILRLYAFSSGSYSSGTDKTKVFNAIKDAMLDELTNTSLHDSGLRDVQFANQDFGGVVADIDPTNGVTISPATVGGSNQRTGIFRNSEGKGLSSVNCGDKGLYVGGGTQNKAFKKALLKEEKFNSFCTS